MRVFESYVLRAGALAALALLAAPSGPALGQGSNAQQPAAGQEAPPPPGPPRSVQFPTPVEKTLANGLRVIAFERSEIPLVAVQMTVKNGGEVDPDELPGLANMTAELLTKGTAKRTAPQIAEAVEALGGSLESGAAWDASRVNLGVMSSRLEPAMEIMADVVRNPSFKDEEVERLRQQTLDELKYALSQPGAVARFVAARVAFGDAPYGHPLSGTPESIARIKRDDIVRLHQSFYRPDNGILVIGGDIKPEAAFRLAEKLFGDWAKPTAALPEPAAGETKRDAAAAGPKARVVVIDKPDAGQAAVTLIRPGLRRTDQDYFRGLVANSVLGGGYSARLNQEIRIKRGLSYGAGSALDVRREVGPFVASTQTKNESGDEVAALLLGELRRLSSEPITDAELTPRKAALIGNFARNLETNDGLVAQVAALANYGLSLGEINKYISSVEAVTAGDVQKFAGGRLDATGASIVIVGNASAFLPDLRKQFQNVEVIPVDELDLNTATLRRAGGGGSK
jgi:zinc protease